MPFIWLHMILEKFTTYWFRSHSWTADNLLEMLSSQGLAQFFSSSEFDAPAMCTALIDCRCCSACFMISVACTWRNFKCPQLWTTGIWWLTCFLDIIKYQFLQHVLEIHNVPDELSWAISNWWESRIPCMPTHSEWSRPVTQIDTYCDQCHKGDLWVSLSWVNHLKAPCADCLWL